MVETFPSRIDQSRRTSLQKEKEKKNGECECWQRLIIVRRGVTLEPTTTTKASGETSSEKEPLSSRHFTTVWALVLLSSSHPVNIVQKRKAVKICPEHFIQPPNVRDELL